MVVHHAVRRAAAPALLDVAVEVLVADPSASLAEVAEAAGVGRTTLHKRYPKRGDLLRAVGHRALDKWEQVIEAAERSDADDGGLRALVEAMVPIGPYLAFLWRTPAFDHSEDINRRWRSVDPRTLAVLKRVQGRGLVRPDLADYWLLQTFYSLVYVAAESVQTGHLARRDAPDLVVDTLLHGIGGRTKP
jgi:AcrR family transcriptional regulator